MTISKPESQITPPVGAKSPSPIQTRRFGLLRYHLAPLALYLIGAIIFTYPLVTQLSDHVINARSGDVWQHLWNQWWMKFSLLDLHTHPFYTTTLFYPDGANLYFHALDPLDGYLALPTHLLFGLVTSFNLQFWFQITIAGYGTYLLTRYLLSHFKPAAPATGAALVAGVIYAFSPLLSELLNLGQLELTAIHWLPLYIYFFLKVMQNEPQKWLNRGACVILLILLSLTTWYYTLYALFFSGLYLLYRLWEVRQAGRKALLTVLLQAIGIIGVYGVLISPLLYLTLKDATSGGTKASQAIFTVIYNSADVQGFFRPGQSALWGIFGSTADASIRGVFLGFIPLILAILGLFTSWKSTRFWLILGAFFAILALGPVLHWAIDLNWTPNDPAVEGGLPLPGRLFYALPFGNIARVPLRFTLVVMLALAVCAAFGISWLQSRPTWRIPAWSIAALAGALVFLEFLPVPRTLASTQVPPFYNQIRTEGARTDFAVLELPDKVTSKAMYYQSVHQHPIVGGYTSRAPANYVFDKNPGIRMLVNWRTPLPQNDIFDRATLRNVPAVLAYYKIRYVIIHPDLLNGEEQELISQRIKETFGEVKPYYQDAEIMVYRTPDNITVPNPNSWQQIYQELGDGWGERLFPTGGNQLVQRELRDRALFSLTNPFQSPLEIELQVPVQAREVAHPLKITLNDAPQPTQPIEVNGTIVKLKLKLNPGLTRLTFAVEGNSAPLLFGTFKITAP